MIVTKGSEGTYLYTASVLTHIIGNDVIVQDTIGAGDSHTAGYILGQQRHHTQIKSCQLANDIASQVVSQIGGSIEKWDDSFLERIG